MSHLDRILAKQAAAAAVSEHSDSPTSDQAGLSEATDLPPLEVVADYRNCKVSLLVDADDIPALLAHPLFLGYAEQIHAAAAAVEQEIDIRSRIDRDRQILRGVR